MGRRRKKPDEVQVELNLTAMVDVAFQVLFFFVVSSATPKDVSTNLNVSQGGAPSESQDEAPPSSTRINIMPEGYALNEAPTTLDELSKTFLLLNKKEQVVIVSATDAVHEQLVTILDECAKNGLTTLAIMSQ